jgi:dienelactone hydrolase
MMRGVRSGAFAVGRVARKGASWLFQALVVFGALLTLFIALTPQGKAGFHTVLFVSQVLELPVKPQTWFTGEPVRHEVHYPSSDGTTVADVYRQEDGKRRAAVVLFLGANAAGRDDPDVVNLGNALARAGYVVMFHWSPTMALRANIEPAETGNLVWAFQYLSEREYVDLDRVGLGGFCVGASFALVASADPRIQDQVHFVNAFGPYYDARTLLLQAASRSVEYDGERTAWDPDKLTKRVLANELIETLDSPEDANALTRRYMNGEALADEELEALSPQAVTIMRLLDGTTPEEAEELYETLPVSFREDLAGVSPSSHVDGIRAKLLIMHDRNDRLVPAAESRRLLEATEGRGEVRYTEVLAFEHVRPSGGGIGDLLAEAGRLYRHMYSIIRIAT